MPSSLKIPEKPSDLAIRIRRATDELLAIRWQLHDLVRTQVARAKSNCRSSTLLHVEIAANFEAALDLTRKALWQHLQRSQSKTQNRSEAKPERFQRAEGILERLERFGQSGSRGYSMFEAMQSLVDHHLGRVATLPSPAGSISEIDQEPKQRKPKLRVA